MAVKSRLPGLPSLPGLPGLLSSPPISMYIVLYIYNTCALSKHMGNMCMRLRNVGKGEASPSLFPRFAPNTHIYLYASTVHMYCIYPAILNRK